MKSFSNRYMLLYALGLAAGVAVVLTLVASGLKEKQQANQRNEKMQQLLETIGVSCQRDEAPEVYSTYFRQEINAAQPGEKPLTIYTFDKDGHQGYVIPTTGNGLWGKIYANVALADDFNTIVGITFSHDSETPGLGAEITSRYFRDRFIGKEILDHDGNVVSVSVQKHADSADPHQVDAISGSTMTSNGVEQMLSSQLRQYQHYITSQRKSTNNEE